jgi:hypothetical protein
MNQCTFVLDSYENDVDNEFDVEATMMLTMSGYKGYDMM